MQLPNVVFNKEIVATQTGAKFKDSQQTFEQTFSTLLAQCTDIDIVSGYIDRWSGNTFGSKLINKAQSGHKVRILVGRAEKEGLHKTTKQAWNNIDVQLRNIDPKNGLYAPKISIHAKVYIFHMLNAPSIVYVGSSNFSRTGFWEWLECTTKPLQGETSNIEAFINNLFTTSLMIDFNQIQTKGSSSYKARMTKQKSGLKSLNTHNLNPTQAQLHAFPLTRIDLTPYGEKNKSISSLNLFHGPGRISNGIYKGRPWYEIELTLGNANYLTIPRNFIAYTDDGYIMPMQRRSGGIKGLPHTGLKDLTSSGNRLIFGEWLKGRLEKSGALIKGDVIDKFTFTAYGSHELKLYDMGNNKFYMSF